MPSQNFNGRWLIAPALFLAFCSQGPSSSPTSPSVPAATVLGVDNGRVGASADGDVKVGAGPLEIVRLRMDRQTSAGVSIFRQYADPGRTYAVIPGETIELWAEYPAAVANPRFKAEWGDGSADIVGCGSCLLKHVYPSAGIYTVRASLDDRISTTVTRIFLLDVRETGPALKSYVYSQFFAAGVGYGAGTPQFDGWASFNASLNTSLHIFDSVAFSGSNAPTVFTCANPAVVAQIANALRGNGVVTTACDGHTWAVAPCASGPALGVDNPACSSCADLYAIRPQIGNTNWGGFNSPSCNSGPSQTLTLTFVGTP